MMIKKLLIGLALGTASVAPFVPAYAAETPAAAVDPARLKIAEQLVLKLVPPGTYQRMMADMAKGDLMQSILGMDAGALAGMAGADADETAKVSGKSMLDLATEKDPHFKERMDIMMKVMFEEMGTMFEKVEPDVRIAMAQIYARKYDAKQLTDLNQFFGSGSGAAFAQNFMASFTDKEMMTASMKAVPVLMEGMPTIMKKVEAATAHLPPMPGTEKASDAMSEGAEDGAAMEESGTEPWYDRENWAAADKKKIGALENTSNGAMDKYLSFELEAIDRSRQQYLKKGWKPEPAPEAEAAAK
jgi:hypothetical protein